MPKKKRAKSKKKKTSFWRYLGRALLFIIKIPYFIYKGISSLVRKTEKSIEKKKIEKRREEMEANHEELKVLKTLEGSYENFTEKFYSSDSQIGVILGSRGSGKTAIGMKMLENAYAKYKKKIFALGFDKNTLPSWISGIDDIKDIKNNSLVLIDEGGILFSSRESMSDPNKLLSKLILIARHKNLTILFISQNSSNLEINILRQADFLILKPSSLLQKEFERKIVQKIYEDVKSDFQKLKKDRGITYIYASNFRGFISNSLPSFWSNKISKSFK